MAHITATKVLRALLYSSCLFPGQARPDELSRMVKGVVLDENGTPVPHADVADFWCIKGAAGRPEPYLDDVISIRHFKANANGEFSGAIPADQPLRALMAMDPDRKSAGLAAGEQLDTQETISITISRTVQVKGRVICKDLKDKPDGLSVAIMTPMSGQILDWMSKDTTDRFSIPLPSGEYRLTAFSDETNPGAKTVTLAPDQSEVDIGLIEVEPSILAKHYGKELPAWTVTDARGITKTVELSDLKGKWVFLELWGHW